MGLILRPPGLWHARNQATARRLNKGESPSSAAHGVAAVQRQVQSPVRLFRGEMMRPRHVMIMVAGGMLAGMVAPIAPARAENPMTPVRPAEPEKTANPTTAPAGRPAAVPATRSTAREPAAAIPTIAPPSGDAGIASVAVALPPAALQRGGRGRGGIRTGRWEFSARLQTPASASSPASADAVPAPPGGMQTTYTTCIERDNAVPADLGPQCSLERQDRRGSQISWSMSCANTGVRSEGLAQYRGDTMQATVVSHIPGAAGRVTDMTQHLTGRYLGSCLPATAALPPAAASAPSNAAGSSQPPAVMPATSPEPATPPATPSAVSRVPATVEPAPAVRAPAAAPPSAAASETASAEDPPGPETRRRHGRHGRYAHRGYRHHHGRSAYGGWYGGGSSFGPRPSSSAGP